MSQSVDATRELAAFLRARREQLTLDDVALPDRGRQRRTPGLRREEVADLAGVSTDYVVRLEQGRGLRPSPEVLDALATALRLTRDERAYLFDLVGHRPTTADPLPAGPSLPLARLVEDLAPLPAMLVDYRFNILAWNGEMAGLMIDFGALPAEQRNTLWLCLLHPDFRGFYRDREKIIREGIADLRAAWAARANDPTLAALIDALNAGSDEFGELWARRDVQVRGRGLKRLRHSRLGPLDVVYEVLIPMQDQDQRLIVYRAADSASQRGLDTIAREASDRRMAYAV